MKLLAISLMTVFCFMAGGAYLSVGMLMIFGGEFGGVIVASFGLGILAFWAMMMLLFRQEVSA